VIAGRPRSAIRRRRRRFGVDRAAGDAMIDKGEASEAHPAFWAPFVVVGEGEAAQYETASAPTPAVTPQTLPVPTHRRQPITAPDWRTEVWRR
jgi:hypothetical protein